MIIKSEHENAGLVKAEYEGDKFKFTHVQDIDTVFEGLKQRGLDQNLNGFSKERSQRFLGTIPDSVILADPELEERLKHGDTAYLLEWFKSEKGKPFCLNKPNTGASGKIIIK